MLSQERKHTPRRQQMPRNQFHIQKIPLILRPTLHDPSLADPNHTRAEARLIQQAPSARTGSVADQDGLQVTPVEWIGQ